MNYSYNKYPATFSGSLYWNKSLKETFQYAKESGQKTTYRQVQRFIKKMPEHNIRIVHKYCKKDNLSKCQIFFEKYNYKDVFLTTDKNLLNPAELTLKTLKGLLNQNSAIYKKIYE